MNNKPLRFHSFGALAALILPTLVMAFAVTSPARASWYTTTTITGPAGSGDFGRVTFSNWHQQNVVVLANGNVVIADNGYDEGAALNIGAVYVYDGSTMSLLSTIKGTRLGDEVGWNIYTLTGSSNFVISSPRWTSPSITRSGAVTWVDGTTGIPRGETLRSDKTYAVSTSNSLVGAFNEDQVGFSGVIALSNGNYVVGSQRANMIIGGAMKTDVGAVTWCNGTSGCTGAVSTTNSLHGTTDNDNISFIGDPNGPGNSSAPTNQTLAISALNNGNYVVTSFLWDNGAATNAGAVTWCNGTSGCIGAVSTTNSLHGTTTDDFVGSASATLSSGRYVGVTSVVALTNGNYVVNNPGWDNGAATNAGAVTWCNGTSGCIGAVSTTNSLHGTATDNNVGSSGVTALTNGNYVVSNSGWDNGAATNAGAVTWVNGTTGNPAGETTRGAAVSTSNSLHGTTDENNVGSSGVTALTNGNYVVRSPNWDGPAANAGAVTWCNGTSGCTGPVSTTNSLHGSITTDNIGSTGVTALTNGNYVVRSPNWDGPAVDVGAVTWVDGTTGNPAGETTRGAAVSTSNSLHGSITTDNVGSSGVTALTNGNYVVRSPNWDGPAANVGAVTWCNGTSGCTGAVSTTNSLHGSRSNDQIGNTGIAAPQNGNYVVFSRVWDLSSSAQDVGAVTWGDGSTGISGPVASTNSLHGSTTSDFVGNDSSSIFLIVSVGSQQNDLFINSPQWDDINSSPRVTNVGAITLFETSTAGPRTIGPISASNSVLGRTASQSLGNTAPVRFDAVNDRVYVHNANSSNVVTVISFGAVSSTSPAGSTSGGTVSVSTPTTPTTPTTSTTAPSTPSLAQSRSSVTIAEFADNSPRITTDLRRQVRAVVDRYPTLTKVECKGFVRTSRPANARQIALADARARNVCTLLKQLKPSLETSISRGSATDNRRRVRLILTK